MLGGNFTCNPTDCVVLCGNAVDADGHPRLGQRNLPRRTGGQDDHWCREVAKSNACDNLRYRFRTARARAMLKSWSLVFEVAVQPV
eukprot:1984332-Rhodomonas_salina.2